MDATGWDERYAQERQWSVEPNRIAADLITPLPAGRALDVAAGEGRMALWLASRGWDVEAVDFSATGLRRGQEHASPDASIAWRVADVLATDLGDEEFDLVLVLYLHLQHDQMADVFARSAAAVRPGGNLLILGHDRDNLVRGVGGPQNAEILHDIALYREAVPDWPMTRLEQVDRRTEAGTAVDTLLFAQRP